MLDGWWDEGFTGENGWAIGGRETNPDEGAQDWADAQDLYRLLEDEIVPRYYDRDARGLPRRWLRPDAAIDGDHDLAVLDDAHARGVRRAAVPARAEEESEVGERARRVGWRTSTLPFGERGGRLPVRVVARRFGADAIDQAMGFHSCRRAEVASVPIDQAMASARLRAKALGGFPRADRPPLMRLRTILDQSWPRDRPRLRWCAGGPGRSICQASASH